MSKRDMVIAIIGIIVVTATFFGGISYQWEEYKPIVELVEVGEVQRKYSIEFLMPMDIETASMWLSWAIYYHQWSIDKMDGDLESLEYHQESIALYNRIMVMFLEFDEEWGVNE